MNHRALALTLALLAASQPVGLLAQGLRASPQLGASRPALPSAPSGPRQADYIVAIVNSEPITNNEVRFRLVRAEQQLVQQGGVLPPRDQMARQVLERMISEKAQLQLAREGGMKVDDTAVDQAEANVARQNQIDVVELRKPAGGRRTVCGAGSATSCAARSCWHACARARSRAQGARLGSRD
jgi:peptidyl-prolyl cis-trans isomerase SurA